jgi:hypothetical protein
MNPVPVVALALAAITVGACNSSSTPSAPATPASPSMTEMFSGTVQPFGDDFHTFVVMQSGTVDITLTAAGPPATIQMGIGVGSPTASTCPHTVSETKYVQAGTTAQVTTNLNAGTYCVDVFDFGNAAQSIGYSVTVAHP